jgi:hypothetical protein
MLAIPLLAFGLIHCSGDEQDSSLANAGKDPPATNGATGTNEPGTGNPDPGDASAPEPRDDDASAPMADGGVDTTKWFGAARCTGSGLAFCDSFEGAAIDTTHWTVEKDGANTATLDTTEHARGSKSLKLHFGSTDIFQYAWLSTQKPFDAVPALRTHVFGRLFYKVENVPTKNMHWTTIEIDGPAADGSLVHLRLGGEYDNFMANYVNGPETAKFSKTPFPTARWVCLEWEYDKAASAIRMWADEQLVSDIEVVGDPTWVHPKTYDKLYVGWQNYQPNLVVPMSVWVDDVAVNQTRIGCTK